MDMIPQDDTPRKRCSICKDFYPATLDYFSACNKVKSGLRANCKKCAHDEYVAHAELRSEQFRKYREEHLEQKKQRDREYQKAHTEKIRQYKKQHYLTHYEQVRSQHQEYYLTHIEEFSQRSRAYRETHIDEKRQQDRLYRETHQEQTRSYSRNRKARKKAAQGTHTGQDILRQYERQKGCCYWCSKELGKGRNAYHVDHIIPLARGGSNGPENIVIACSKCNRSKSAKLPHEWPEGGKLL